MRKSSCALLVLGMVAFFLSLVLPLNASPAAGVKLTTPFHKIVISRDQEVRLNIDIANTGDREELLDLTILSPEGWEASLSSAGYLIKSLYLALNDSLSIDFVASLLPEGEEGNHTFVISAISRDMMVNASLSIEVEVIEAALGGFSLSTQYHSIEGQSGEDYEFLIRIRNTHSDRVVDFSSIHPEGWKVSFMPDLRELTQVRSLDFKAGETKTLWALVSPPTEEEPDEYNLTIVASSIDGSLEELDLNVIITGIYRLDLSTPEGVLSMSAVQGEESHTTIVLKNDGTAPLESISFSAVEPKGWDVSFEPDEISSIVSDASRDIKVKIKPPSDAIPGDYQIDLIAKADQPYLTHTNLQLRVSVQGSLTWGFLGIGVIVFMVALLLVVFWRLGRR